MRLIEPTAVNIRHMKTGDRTWVRYREHHDGSVDANVKVDAIRISVSDGSMSRPHIEAIGALEQATQNYRLAQHSGSPEWKQAAERALVDARDRVHQTQ